MFSSLFKHLIIQQQKIFRLQIKTLSTVKDGVNGIRDTGIVKRFSQDKGFGFIKRDSNGNDVFVHFQSILGTGFKTLQEGQQVEFKVFQGVKGLEARNNQVKTFTNDRHIGIVRKFIKNRGFGFITRKSDGADLFVHSRSIRHTGLESLEEGMEVEFLEIQSNRGAEAKDIRIINKIDSIENTSPIGFFKISNSIFRFYFNRESEKRIWYKELEINQQTQFRIQQTEKVNFSYYMKFKI
ncbi:unnamed protein product [Rotaria sordida]|uniref:CSD domain-containing protein n=1 Tax=Rotaria sordida TaxID=392033 RepID=A0A813SUK3_9BILA|nr:unnamed protein product [Rotaria sordida]CAF0800900.1 unnamed protein product [Rotaria sordida]